MVALPFFGLRDAAAPVSQEVLVRGSSSLGTSEHRNFGTMTPTCSHRHARVLASACPRTRIWRARSWCRALSASYITMALHFYALPI
jgi:hypothetical protein